MAAPTSSQLNLFAKPFTPAAQTPKPTEQSDTGEIGTKVENGEWELERVREFVCDGELSDYEELEELEIAAAKGAAKYAVAEDTCSESDYTSTDEEDFQVMRQRLTNEFLHFSRAMAEGHS